MTRKELKQYAVLYNGIQDKFDSNDPDSEEFMLLIEFLSIKFMGKKAYNKILDSMLDGDHPEIFSSFTIIDSDRFCDWILPIINGSVKTYKCHLAERIDGDFSIISTETSKTLGIVSAEEAKLDKYKGFFDYEC